MSAPPAPLLLSKLPVSNRGLWLLHICEDGAELQDLESGLCLEVRPEPQGEGTYSLCRFEAGAECPDTTCQEKEAGGDVCGFDVASGLSHDGAFRLIHQLAERVGALDLKDFLEVTL